MMNWSEKHRPKTVEEVLGNPTAVSDLRKWAQAWIRGNPDRRAVILQGPPGVGKTSAALALAHDMDWTPIEMNASDARNAAAIERVATRGSLLQTFSDEGEFLQAKKGGRKLIILDEADNVFGREDKGGIAAIVDLIRQTRQPVVLIVNDYYALTRRSSGLRRLCKTIKFQPINRAAMKSLLRNVCAAEGVTAADEVLDFIVERAEGDLRSALNDLEGLAIGKRSLSGEDTKAVGFRDRERTIFAALEEIFRSGDLKRARAAMMGLDESPEDMILWVDHNVPHEYSDRGDLVRAFSELSKADVYLGRVRRRQAYGLWSYASERMSVGVALAREGRARGGQLEFPLYLMAMSRSRAARTARNSLARKLGRHLHASTNLVLTDVLPAFKALFANDEEFRIRATADLGLDEKEVALLLDESEDSHAVKHLLEKAGQISGSVAASVERSALSRFDENEGDAG
ncbi:MAG TPA: replication factor C large subunit [Thermoplasmata archaeon]|jgi:replication factor C large subunit